MSVSLLKTDLSKERAFLEELHDSNKLQVRHLLNLASKKQLVILVKFIHLLTSGKVRFPKDVFEKVVKSKKLSFLKEEFHSAEKVQELLVGKRANILGRLYKIQSVISILLTPMFAQ
jgi:hypothetical protein